MLPIEKAKQLIKKYNEYAYTPWNGGKDEMSTEEASKECALIAVEELINMANLYDIHNAKEPTHIYTFNVVLYWQEVKSELERL